MTQKELINVFKYIVKKCDMLINNGNYEADDYTQDTVEDIAELCNHILDGDYGELVEVEEVDLEKYYHDFLQKEWFDKNCSRTMSEMMAFTAKHFFELGLKAQKGEEV